MQLEYLQSAERNTVHHSPDILHQVELHAYFQDELQVQTEATSVAAHLAVEEVQAILLCQCSVVCPQCHLVELCVSQ